MWKPCSPGARPEISAWTCIVPSVCVKVTRPSTLLALVCKRIATALLIGAASLCAFFSSWRATAGLRRLERAMQTREPTASAVAPFLIDMSFLPQVDGVLIVCASHVRGWLPSYLSPPFLSRGFLALSGKVPGKRPENARGLAEIDSFSWNFRALPT